MTPASDLRPTRRRMTSRGYWGLPGDEYVVEMHRTVLKVRPKRTRSGGPAEVVVPIGILYQHALVERLVAEKKAKKAARRKKRGAA